MWIVINASLCKITESAALVSRGSDLGRFYPDPTFGKIPDPTFGKKSDPDPTIVKKSDPDPTFGKNSENFFWEVGSDFLPKVGSLFF